MEKEKINYLGSVKDYSGSLLTKLIPIGEPIEITIRNWAEDGWEFICADKNGCHWELLKKAEDQIMEGYPVANSFGEISLSDPYVHTCYNTGKYQAYFRLEGASQDEIKRFAKEEGSKQIIYLEDLLKRLYEIEKLSETL